MTGLMEGKRLMISQPMGGRSEEEIKQVREKVKKKVEERGFQFVNTFFKDEFNQEIDTNRTLHIPLYFLAKSLEVMSSCHVVVFVDDWEEARGCMVEHEAAVAYGLEIYYYYSETNDLIKSDLDTKGCCISPGESSRILEALKEE